jgi:hypothetical protein
MTRANMIALVGLIALRAPVALAADPATETVSVGGSSYSAYVDDGEAWVVQSPAPATLTRDASRRGPACDIVDENLAPLAAYVDSCKIADASPTTCAYVRSLIDLVRFDPGTIGVSELEQHWSHSPQASRPANTNAVLTAVRQATGLAASAIHFVADPVPLDAAQGGEPLVAPTGRSWASKLLGLVDLAPGLSYENGVWVTRDHVLACGLSAGDVRLIWDQPAELATTAPLLTDAEFWQVYQALAATDFAALDAALHDRKLVAGSAIGRALAGLTDGAHFAAAAALVLESFFDPNTSELHDQLSEADVVALLSSAPHRTLTWSAKILQP